MDRDTWAKNVTELFNGVQDGFGTKLIDLKYEDPRFELMTSFRYNIQAFAAFKNHHEIGELINQLKDESGALKPFAQYQEDVSLIIGKYEQRYLQAEFNHAVASAQMSDKWLDYERDKGEFPFLRYETQNDERVRDSHADLDGITLPIEHSFWDSFFPPIGWGCRCTLRQVAQADEIPNDEDLPNSQQVPSVFRNNPARSGELFASNHPYFEGMDQDQADNIIFQKNKFVFDSFKSSDYKQLLHDSKTGGYAVIHDKHNKKEAKVNEATATILAKQGQGVELVENAKNAPSSIWNGKLWAFKNIPGTLEDLEGNITTAIESAKRQANRVLLVLDNKTIDVDFNSIIKKATANSNIIEVAILNGEDELLKIQL